MMVRAVCINMHTQITARALVLLAPFNPSRITTFSLTTVLVKRLSPSLRIRIYIYYRFVQIYIHSAISYTIELQTQKLLLCAHLRKFLIFLNLMWQVVQLNLIVYIAVTYRNKQCAFNATFLFVCFKFIFLTVKRCLARVAYFLYFSTKTFCNYE